MAKKTIKITDSQLHKIIKESIKDSLMESHTQNLYHYITGKNLLVLLKNNRMRTCNPETYIDSYDKKSKYIDGENKRYLSLTRNKNATEGYPVLKYGEFGDGDGHFICRIELDGDYLNTYNIKKQDKRFKQGGKRVPIKIKPMDWPYWEYGEGGDKERFADETSGIFASNGKEWQMQSDSSNYYYPIDNDATDKYNHPMSQAEDRLTTTEKFIPNANKFIKKIDIYVSYEIDSNDYSLLKKILIYASKIGIEVNFYDNINYFNKQIESKTIEITDVANMI